jgi:hypothetical protein
VGGFSAYRDLKAYRVIDAKKILFQCHFEGLPPSPKLRSCGSRTFSARMHEEILIKMRDKENHKFLRFGASLASGSGRKRGGATRYQHRAGLPHFWRN